MNLRPFLLPACILPPSLLLPPWLLSRPGKPGEWILGRALLQWVCTPAPPISGYLNFPVLRDSGPLEEEPPCLQESPPLGPGPCVGTRASVLTAPARPELTEGQSLPSVLTTALWAVYLWQPHLMDRDTEARRRPPSLGPSTVFNYCTIPGTLPNTVILFKV